MKSDRETPRPTPVPITEQRDRNGGRVCRDYFWLDGSTMADVLGIDSMTAADLPELLASVDPYDRARAYVLLRRLTQRTVLPDGTWTVFSTYKSGWGGEGRKAIWSAHPTEEDARRWHAAWDAHWKAKDEWRPGGTDYDTQVAPMDDVPAHYLRFAGSTPRMPS